jgi:hypothetical protein
LYDHNPMTTAANQQLEQLSREELLALVIQQQEIIALLREKAPAQVTRWRPTHRS